MHRLSLTQALALWGDLKDAYYGKASYGSTVTEIYIYRLMPYSPSVANPPPDRFGPIGQAVDEAYAEANETLYLLLKHFEENEDATVGIELEPRVFRPLSEWHYKERSYIFEHRVHIEVKPK